MDRRRKGRAGGRQRPLPIARKLAAVMLVLLVVHHRHHA
jgi:hypothetical protein